MSHDQPPSTPLPKEAADGSAVVYNSVEAYQAARQTHALVTNRSVVDQTAALAASKNLPDLSISGQNSPIAFIKGFGQGVAHALVQAPLEGSAQLFDHTLGQLFNSHLYEKSKDLVIGAPEQATFGSAEWHGQSIGSVVGMTPLLLTTRTGLRSLAALSEVGGALVASEAEVFGSKKLFSAVAGKMVLEGGATGAAYSTLFKAVNQNGTADSGNFWRPKAAAMASDFATFSTLTAGSIAIGGQLKSAVAPLVETFPKRAALLKNIAGLAGAGLSGIPAAAVDTIGEYAQSGDSSNLSPQRFAQNAYSYALLGALMEPLHSKAERTAAAVGASFTTYGQFADTDQLLRVKVAEHPELQNWLRDNPQISANLKEALVLTWDDFPDSYKKMDAQALQPVMRVWSRMDKADWARVSAADAPAFARTINQLNLYPKDTQYLAYSPEVTRLYLAHEAAFEHDGATLIAAARVWKILTPEQRELPIDQLKATVQLVDSHTTLARVYGEDSSVVDHLRTLEKPGEVSPLIDVSSWLVKVYQSEGDQPYARAAAVVQDLVDNKAGRESFMPLSLSNQLTSQSLFHDNPAMQAKVEQTFPDLETRRQVLDFIMKKPAAHGAMIEAAIDLGFSGADHHWVDFHAVNNLHASLSLPLEGNQSSSEPIAPAKLFELLAQRVDIDGLTKYVTQNPGKKATIKTLIEEGAGRQVLNLKSLQELDNLPRLSGFNEIELAQVRALHDQGLSIVRLHNHLTDSPDGAVHIRQLLAQGADVRTLDNHMKLSTYPGHISFKITEAINKQTITIADVVAKTRDWQSGRHFRDLLIKHVMHEGTLSGDELQNLHERAQAWTFKNKGGSSSSASLRSERHLLKEVPEAGTFVETLRGINRKIPANQPIVLLGRDAWPLLPLLRMQGRDVQYFLWSRLQMEDALTKKQWLKEIPPNAAIIDTGYSGSIIKAIREIDPGVSGFLMSKTFGARFPRLLSSSDHRSAVERIENFPKLIFRTSAHTENGGAVSKRNEGHDVDSKFSFHENSRWFAERRARQLLTATGLPSWDVWRYSTFVGLTPMERLGLSDKTALDSHYQRIAALRAAHGSR